MMNIRFLNPKIISGPDKVEIGCEQEYIISLEFTKGVDSKATTVKLKIIMMFDEYEPSFRFKGKITSIIKHEEAIKCVCFVEGDYDPAKKTSLFFFMKGLDKPQCIN